MRDLSLLSCFLTVVFTVDDLSALLAAPLHRPTRCSAVCSACVATIACNTVLAAMSDVGVMHELLFALLGYTGGLAA